MGAAYQHFLRKEREKQQQEAADYARRISEQQAAARISQAELNVECALRQGGPLDSSAREKYLWESSLKITKIRMQGCPDYQKRLKESAPDSPFAKRHADFLDLLKEMSV
jgi:uncharacterized membrane protein